MASQVIFLLCVFLITQVRVRGFDESIVNIILANEESQYVGQFPRTAINITLNVSSVNNISDSLEQCADAGRPFLFTKNTTILGCGSLLWPENVPYTASLNMTSVFSTLNVSPSRIITSTSHGNVTSPSLSDGNMSSAIHSSAKLVTRTANLAPLESTLSNGDFSRTIISSLDNSLSRTIRPSSAMVLTTSSLGALESTLSKGDSSRNIISSPDDSLSDTTQPSNSIVILSTITVPSNGTVTNVNYTSVVSSPHASFSGTMQPSTLAVNISTSSIPLNGTQTNGNSGGITSSPNGTFSQTLQRSHSTVIATSSSVQSSHASYSLSASIVLVNLTTSATPLTGTHSIGIFRGYRMASSHVPSNSTLSSGARTSPNVSQPTSTEILTSNGLGNATNSLATSSASDSARFRSTISPNSTYSVNTIIQQNSSVSETSSLPPSKRREFGDAINRTKTLSPNGTYSMTVTIQPSSTTAHKPHSSQLQVTGVSNTSSAVLHTNLTVKYTNSCRNSTITNLTELVRAYETKFFGEVSITAFTKTNYTMWVQNTDNLSINCCFIPGDGTPGVVAETNLSSVSFPHRYFRPGRYRARINCVQNDIVLVKFSRRIIVSLPVVRSELSCPDLFQTDTTYYCVFTVDQGSILDILVAIGNGSKATHSFPETSVKVISAENETIHDLKNITLGLYSPLLVFKHAFYLRCVELLSNTSGTIHLKIFRPVIEVNVSSEPIGNLSCQVPTNTSISNTTICFQSSVSVLRNLSGNLAPMDYTAVHNLTLTVVSGDNFITIPTADVFKTKPGDVIGYIMDQSERSISSLASNTSTNRTSVTHDMFQKFSLYGFVPYEAKVAIRFTNPGVGPLAFTIRELQSLVTEHRNLITVQRPVSGLTLYYKHIIRINTTRSIGFDLSRGTNSKCYWLLTGRIVNMSGAVNYTTQYANYTVGKNDTDANAFEGLVTSFQYLHNVPDDITFLVNCSNKVSTLFKNVTISVRRNISDFKASLCYASFAYTSAQTCWTSRANGDHVGYKWTIEDKDYRTAKVELELKSSSLPRNKTRVDVMAWNVVSKEKLVLQLDVLRNPLSIQVLPALSVASGDTVSITPVLSWSPYRNGTAFYTDYGINISSALQEFIDFPIFEVKIDDALQSGNVSNGTQLTYKFPSAGSKRVIYDVYIEAKGHKEMNRKIEVQVLDRVKDVRIVSTCSNQVVIGKTCTFTPEFGGSDVSCDWAVDSQPFKDNCKKITHDFNDLGNFTVTLHASNEISSQNAFYNITVVPRSVPEPGNETTRIKLLATSSISSSVGMTMSHTMSLFSTAVHPSPSKSGPSSRSVDLPSKSVQITGPVFAAVGETVTFHANNVDSSTELFWVVNNTRLPTSNHSISHSFHQPGKFKVFVNTSTSNKNASFTVIVQDLVSGLKVFIFQKPFSQHVDVLFSIDSGTDVSYSLNFGDNSETSVGSIHELSVNISVQHLYVQPGYYNLRILVFNKVGTNNTEYRKISVACKLKSAVLHGASSDSKNPSQFSDKDVIVLALKTIFNCTTTLTFKCRWKVVKLNSSIPKEIPVKLANTHEAAFPGSDLSNGYYKVEATVVDSTNGTILTRFGYFNKVSEKLDVRITCGITRMVSVDEPLTVNATVITGSASVTYEWSCDHVSNGTCFGNDIKSNASSIWFPGNYFNADEVYKFLVKVSDGQREGAASQRITFGFSNATLDLCLSSSQGNQQSVFFSSSKDTQIIPLCSRCSSIPQLHWSWRVSKISHLLNSTTQCDFDKLILNSSQLIIPAGTLQPDTLYKIQLNATSYTQNITGFWSYEFQTNDIPRSGYCEIQSHDSAPLLNAFEISCYAWYDRDRPLNYEYWYSTDGDRYALFYRGELPTSGLTFFKAGLPEKGFIINVKIVIEDSLGESTVQFLVVKNPPPTDNLVEEFFNSSQQIDAQVENLLNDRNVQGALQFLQTVSIMLNEKSSETEGSSKGVEVRERILGNIKKLCCSDVVATKQAVEVVLSAVSVPSELNLQAQLHTSTIYLNITQNLNMITNKTDVKNIAGKIATGISLLMSSVTGNNTIRTNEINEAWLLVLDNLGNALLNQTEPGAPAVIVTTSLFTMAVQKHFPAKFPGTRLALPNQITEFVTPEKMTRIQGDFVSSKMISMSENPFLWETSDRLNPNTNVASLDLLNSHENKLKMNDLVEPFHIFLESRDPPQALTQDSPQSLAKHAYTLTEDSEPDLFEINTTTSNAAILVTIPQICAYNKGQLRMRIRRPNQSYGTASELIVSTTSSFPVSLTWRGLSASGTYYVSIEYESLSFRLAGRPNKVEYSVSFQEISCHYWNESSKSWRENGCKVGLRSTTTTTHCECNHLTWFGGRVVVAPNSITFAKISERIKDLTNYVTILSVLSSVLVLYCLLLVWARRRDIEDEGKNGITWCPSNHVTDTYQYQVIIHTGFRRNAGTSANVGLMLSGELGKSRKCLLKSYKREVLKRGHVDSFLVTTTGSLGSLDYLRIWHDNTGSDPAWFLNRVVVLDSETGRAENFLCYRWLAVDEGDGQIQRLLPIAGAQDLKRFRHLFVSRATTELTDAHLWFSVAFRPVSSPFTRVQRVSCCLTLLLTSMMANAMWYGTGESGNTSQIDLGLFSFSWDELFIGICSSLIVFPVNLLLVQIFRHCRAKSKHLTTRQLSFIPLENSKVKPETHGLARDPPRDVSPVITSSRETSKRIRKSSQLSYIVVLPNGARSVDSLRGHADSPSQRTSQFKDNNMLPFWCQYIGWAGVFLTCVTSAAVTFLYAIEFGEDKTRQWLLSLTISLVNDVFIAQPSKVLIVTVVLAYILKRPLKERYACDEVIEQEAFENASPEETEVEAPDFNLCTADDFLRAAREKREKDKFMYGLMKSVFYHLCFTVLVLIIAYGQRDLMGYHLTATQENTFVYRNYKEQSLQKQNYGFYQVANVKDFWHWNKAVLLPGLSNYEWFNTTGEWSTFTENFGGFLLGSARIRQKRLRIDVCDVLPMFQDVIENCSGNYEWSDEDKAGYENSWSKPSGNNDLCNTENTGTLPPDHWCYTRLSGLITAPYVGRLETYSGGGYSQNFGQSYEVSLNLTRVLQVHKWIDKYTRAVFVEFTLYNPNVNLFSITTLLFEVSSSGDFNPGTNLLSIRLYNYVGNFQIFVLICQLLFLGFLCVYTYNSAKGIFRQTWRFFTKAWNFYEFVLVVVSWLAFALYFVAIVFRKRILQEFREDPTKFTSFRHSASWQMSLEYAIAALVFMVSLKFLRLFQFNRRMYLLSLTLSNAAYELLSYTVVFSIVLMAFSLLYHLMLQPYNANFVNLVGTIRTLLRVLVGKSDVLVTRHQFPVLERIVIFVYMCLMKFILLNIFIVILNDGFSRARAKNDTQQNAFEFVDFMKSTVGEFLGIRRLNATKKESGSSVKSQRHVRFKVEKSMTNVERTLKKLEKKAEKLLNIVQSDSFKETFYDETEDDLL